MKWVIKRTSRVIIRTSKRTSHAREETYFCGLSTFERVFSYCEEEGEGCEHFNTPEEAAELLHKCTFNMHGVYKRNRYEVHLDLSNYYSEGSCFYEVVPSGIYL